MPEYFVFSLRADDVLYAAGLLLAVPVLWLCVAVARWLGRGIGGRK